MCGIAGMFAYRDSAPPVEESELLAVREAMVHRGPDGAGLWISPDRRLGLAHRRLAIIDLSGTGAQPMASADGRFHVTFNGEIYNYRELRRELEGKGYALRSQSDTEVLLHLYADCRADMVHRLRGMYAFAIWDAREQTLFLARDPFGIKPLYYADDGATLRFASQVKALLAGGAVDAAPEPAGAAGFLIWGCVPEPFTLYRGIVALPAGAHLTVRRGAEARIAAHFSVRDELLRAQAEARPFHERDREALGESLRDTMRHHLVSDVPVGVFLSAGVDSNLVAGLAAEQSGVSLRTLTLGFEEYRGTVDDEVPLAEKSAAALGTRHETHWIRRGDFEGELGAILAAMDQPTTDGVNTWFVCREAARAGLKVALSGLGGDELFGGYPSFRDVPRLARWLRPAALLPLAGRLARVVLAPAFSALTSPKYAGLLEYGGRVEGAYLLRRALFMPWELGEVLDPVAMHTGLERLQTLPMLADSIRGVGDDRARVAALELTWYMRNQLLRDADWAGMAHSVEVRVPFVDATLFRALAPWLVSGNAPVKADAAAAPRRPLAPEILERPKSGFSVPIKDWLATKANDQGAPDRGLRGWARAVIGRSEVADALTLPEGARRSQPAAMFVRALYAATNAALRGLAILLWPGKPPAVAERICVYCIGNIGDIVCALPAVRAVRQAYPDARITFLSSPGTRGLPGAPEVLAGFDWIDEIRAYYSDDIESFFKRWALLKELRSKRFDIWIELPNNLSPVYRQFRDMFFTRMAGVSWARGWRVDTLHLAASAQSVHLVFKNEVERTVDILQASGIPAGAVDFGFPREAATVSRVDECIGPIADPPGLLVAIAPGAKRSTNLWPAERFAEVGRYLVRAGASVVVLGGDGDVATCAALSAQIGGGARSLAGTLSIADCCEVLRRCRVLVCVDSGVQHLAAAVGTPCISLFSFWQMRGKWRPYGKRNVVLQKWVDCHTCMLNQCPRDNLCMKKILVTDVTARLDSLLQFRDLSSSAVQNGGHTAARHASAAPAVT